MDQKANLIRRCKQSVNIFDPGKIIATWGPMSMNRIEMGIKHAFARPMLRQEPAQEVKTLKPCRINQKSRQSPRLKTISKRQEESRHKDRGAQPSHNTRLLGGQRAAANCRFDGSVAVYASLAASCRQCGNFSKRDPLVSICKRFMSAQN
jgi:hypothetical protein